MSWHDDLNALADRYGVFASFYDLQGNERIAGVETKMALLRGLGVAIESPEQAGELLASIRAEDSQRILQRELIVAAGEACSHFCGEKVEWTLVLEDQDTAFTEGSAEGEIHLPPMPSGVHTLYVKRGDIEQQTTFLAAPSKMPVLGEVLAQERIWGVNGALYGLQSPRNFGLGDFADLAFAGKALAGFGVSFLGINPVHALGWADATTYSPYSPSHRGYLNSAHVALDQINGLGDIPEAAEILSRLRSTNPNGDPSETIRYKEFYRAQKQALADLHRVFKSKAHANAMDDFRQFCLSSGDSLVRFALFEAISEKEGPDWRVWPQELQSPASVEALSARVSLADRIEFHQWLQWIAASQLKLAQIEAREAGMRAGLYLDLAVGARKSGAEAWCESGIIAKGVSIGAPPDQLSPAGQNWDLAPHSPLLASKTQYAAFRKILANTMGQCGILRIDHVLGMNRSFWLPDDGSAGGYIRQPFESLLAIIAIEAERAGTIIVGEDLGLVPDGFRDTLKARGLYSYTVLQYEKDHTGAFRHPDHLSAQSLACFGTHDTPTLNGYLHCGDIEWWRKLGWIDEGRMEHSREHRCFEIAGLIGTDCDRLDYDTAFTRVHARLAYCPAAMVSVQLDDIFGTIEAQNLPGTIEEHPNWRRRYPLPVSEFASIQRLQKLRNVMGEASRNITIEQTGEARNAV